MRVRPSELSSLSMANRSLRLATSNGFREPDWADALEKHPDKAHWVDQLRAEWKARHQQPRPPRSPTAIPSTKCVWAGDARGLGRADCSPRSGRRGVAPRAETHPTTTVN